MRQFGKIIPKDLVNIWQSQQSTDPKRCPINKCWGFSCNECRRKRTNINWRLHSKLAWQTMTWTKLLLPVKRIRLSRNNRKQGKHFWNYGPEAPKKTTTAPDLNEQPVYKCRRSKRLRSQRLQQHQISTYTRTRTANGASDWRAYSKTAAIQKLAKQHQISIYSPCVIADGASDWGAKDCNSTRSQPTPTQEPQTEQATERTNSKTVQKFAEHKQETTKPLRCVQKEIW